MKLISDYEVKLEDIVVVGHSLGSHVGGFCSKHLQNNGIGIPGEIWGLDPAGPGFEGRDCKNSLCVSDAKFVQTFHTSSAYGMHKAIGNKDFYFNGGSYQPNCEYPELEHWHSMSKLLLLNAQILQARRQTVRCVHTPVRSSFWSILFVIPSASTSGRSGSEVNLLRRQWNVLRILVPAWDHWPINLQPTEPSTLTRRVWQLNAFRIPRHLLISYQDEMRWECHRCDSQSLTNEKSSVTITCWTYLRSDTCSCSRKIINHISYIQWMYYKALSDHALFRPHHVPE